MFKKSSSDENEDPGGTTTAVVYASADDSGTFPEQDGNITITTQPTTGDATSYVSLPTPKPAGGAGHGTPAGVQPACSVCQKIFKSRYSSFLRFFIF